MNSVGLLRSFAVTSPSTDLGLALKVGQILSARVLSFADGRADLAIGRWRFSARLATSLPESDQVFLQVKTISPEKVVFRLLPDNRFTKQTANQPENSHLTNKELAPLFSQPIDPLVSREDLARNLRELFSLPLTKLIDTTQPDSLAKLAKALQFLNKPANQQEEGVLTLFIPVIIEDQKYEAYLTISQDTQQTSTAARPVRFCCSLETANLGVITIETVLVGKTIDCLIRGSSRASVRLHQHLPELQQRFEVLGFSPRYIAVTEEVQSAPQSPQIPRLSIDIRL